MDLEEEEIEEMIVKTDKVITLLEKNRDVLYEALTTTMFTGNEKVSDDKDTVIDISGLHGYTTNIIERSQRYKKKLHDLLRHIRNS